MHAGVARLDVSENKVELASYSVEKLDGAVADSPRMLALLESYQQMIKAEGLLESFPRIPHEDAKFVGDGPCVRCHSLPTHRYGKSKHSHAFDIIVERGRDHDPECVACHTVGFGYKSGFISPDATPNLKHVGCEDCHGPAEKHVAEPMQETYGEIPQETCDQCHTPENSPGFVYEEKIGEIQHNTFFLCSAKICHWLD
jgi:hypothetical protein